MRLVTNLDDPSELVTIDDLESFLNFSTLILSEKIDPEKAKKVLKKNLYDFVIYSLSPPDPKGNYLVFKEALKALEKYDECYEASLHHVDYLPRLSTMNAMETIKSALPYLEDKSKQRSKGGSSRKVEQRVCIKFLIAFFNAAYQQEPTSTIPNNNSLSETEVLEKSSECIRFIEQVFSTIFQKLEHRNFQNDRYKNDALNFWQLKNITTIRDIIVKEKRTVADLLGEKTERDSLRRYKEQSNGIFHLIKFDHLSKDNQQKHTASLDHVK